MERPAHSYSGCAGNVDRVGYLAVAGSAWLSGSATGRDFGGAHAFDGDGLCATPHRAASCSLYRRYAARALAGAARHEPVLEDLAQRIAELRYGAADLSSELARYLDGLDADGASLDELHTRRSAIAGLQRRLSTDLDGVLAHAARAREAVAADDAWDETLANRREHERRCEARVVELAARVSSGRHAAADALAEGYTTVDDIDTFAGLAATVFSVADLGLVEPGHYGQADGASAVLPPSP